MTFVEKQLNTAVEKCIEILSHPAYNSSYAAPREAFRNILTESMELAAREQIDRTRRLVLSTMFVEVQKAAKQTIPDRMAGNKTDHVITQDKLEDYAERVYKVALENVDWNLLNQ